MLAGLETLLPWRFSPAILTAALVAAALHWRGAGRVSPPVTMGHRVLTRHSIGS